MLTDTQIAYAAGLFEGEGTVWVRQGTLTMSRAAGMAVGMTDLDPLERMLDTFGGKIYGPFVKKGCKPIYHWRLDGWDAVERIYAVIGDYLSVRRRAQFERAIAAAPPPDRRGHGTINRNKMHCPEGHPYDEANTYRFGNARYCRICRREAGRRYDAKQRASRSSPIGMS